MVSVEHLSKSFDKKLILQDINLEFSAGSMNAIVGESGCGKTTLLNLLGGLESPSSGNVLYDQKPIGKHPTKRLRYEIGYLFQNYALIDNQSVEENLKIALAYQKECTSKKEWIKQALSEVGLSGYEKQKIYTLSGGEQQRVALARLLIKPCKVILADEPTGNLDEHNRDAVIQILKKMKDDGKCVILATHDPQIAKACDQLITLMKIK